MKRIANDFYPTEEALTRYLLKFMQDAVSGKVLEPCAGQYHISDVLQDSGLYPVTTDITDGDRYDATKPEYWQKIAPKVDWVITNPPFNVAHLIVPQAFDHARRGIAMLLRLSYQEPCVNRADWLKANAKHLKWLIIFNPRPRFRGDTKGSDNVTVAWQVWDKYWESGTKVIYANDWKNAKTNT